MFEMELNDFSFFCVKRSQCFDACSLNLKLKKIFLFCFFCAYFFIKHIKQVPFAFLKQWVQVHQFFLFYMHCRIIGEEWDPHFEGGGGYMENLGGKIPLQRVKG